ncbi:MAG: YtxH domain-containing protein [Actinomycetia bacterium]|nr:YtxH domain-containing protein [Actinomycetes bacterium]
MSRESAGFGLGGFVLGALVGAAAGLLFAPKPGKETREFLAEKAKDYINSAEDIYATGKDKAVELYSTASDKAGVANTQIREKIEIARARLNAAVSSAAETAGEGLQAAGEKVAKVASSDEGEAAPAEEAAPAQ